MTPVTLFLASGNPAQPRFAQNGVYPVFNPVQNSTKNPQIRVTQVTNSPDWNLR